jgi:hypothetical protein
MKNMKKQSPVRKAIIVEHLCEKCGCKAPEKGHLCSPKKGGFVYVCMGCGIITLEKELICRPKKLRLM